MIFNILYALIVLAWLARIVRHVLISVENKESPKYITVVRYSILAVLALAAVQLVEYLLNTAFAK
ncbi:hypothetical protein [Chryseolinea lacunae]|uniref:DUF1146 domain-containing protein n=1 Tax=Chryseolinea lacunae TaxID=2801331 RepID=A0ABS1KP92_9BACT|nr:hypothetical protein [Chryseolinea lacunae]MBL0741270.1 hypothetical protein [Chryseolinea lacunae]